MNLKKIAALAGVASLGCATAAQAQVTWVPIGRWGDDVISVMPAAARDADGHARIWAKWEFPGTHTTVWLNEVDCNDRRMRILEATGYADRALQQPIGKGTNSSEWGPTVPGKLDDAFVTEACTARPATWFRVGQDAAGALWVSPQITKQADGHVLIWERMQWDVPDKYGATAMVNLDEVDCAERRTQTLQITPYIDHDLRQALVPEQSARVWESVRPDSIGDDVVASACLWADGR
jgi:hypothetical protein